MSYSFDYVNNLINVSLDQTTVQAQDLYSSIVEEESSERGIVFPKIATATGLDRLSTSTQTGITCNISNLWQIKFQPGLYTATISSGNITGGVDENPIAYTSGVQVIRIESASATVVTVVGGLTDDQNDKLNIINNMAKLIPASLSK